MNTHAYFYKSLWQQHFYNVFVPLFFLLLRSNRKIYELFRKHNLNSFTLLWFWQNTDWSALTADMYWSWEKLAKRELQYKWLPSFFEYFLNSLCLQLCSCLEKKIKSFLICKMSKEYFNLHIVLQICLNSSLCLLESYTRFPLQ